MLCYDMVNKQINRYKLWNSEEYMMHTIEPSPCVADPINNHKMKYVKEALIEEGLR